MRAVADDKCAHQLGYVRTRYIINVYYTAYRRNKTSYLLHIYYIILTEIIAAHKVTVHENDIYMYIYVYTICFVHACVPQN